jgi:hypothetical protein
MQRCSSAVSVFSPVLPVLTCAKERLSKPHMAQMRCSIKPLSHSAFVGKARLERSLCTSHELTRCRLSTAWWDFVDSAVS